MFLQSLSICVGVTWQMTERQTDISKILFGCTYLILIYLFLYIKYPHMSDIIALNIRTSNFSISIYCPSSLYFLPATSYRHFSLALSHWLIFILLSSIHSSLNPQSPYHPTPLSLLASLLNHTPSCCAYVRFTPGPQGLIGTGWTSSQWSCPSCSGCGPTTPASSLEIS